LTGEGDPIRGDFIYSMPGFYLINDMADHKASVKIIASWNVRMLYAGHGKPVLREQFLKKYASQRSS
jgi:hypothetical protein